MDNVAVVEKESKLYFCFFLHKVFEASRLKSEALQEQQKRMEMLSNADHKVALLAKNITKSIQRAKWVDDP